MKKSVLFVICIAIVLLANAQSQNTTATSKAQYSETQKKELQKVKSKIEEQNCNFARFYLNGQADSLKTIFSQNVKQYISHQTPTNNLEELLEKSQLLMSWGKWEFELSTEEVKLAGNFAIERGKYKLSFTPNENSLVPASTDSGNYIVLWEEIEGKWKIVWDAPVTEIPLQ